MSNHWFTADTHFLHASMPATGKGWRPFATMEEHDETLIENWNKVVRPQDIVWHLGDVGIGHAADILNVCRRLNGRKQLIAGNHDQVWPGHRDSYLHQRKWLEVFESVQSLARRRIGRDHVLMCHLPYEGDHVGDERYARFRLRDEGLWLLHGHVHDAWKVRGCQINVGVDVWGWRPVNLEEIHKIIDGVSSPTVVQRDRVSG